MTDKNKTTQDKTIPNFDLNLISELHIGLNRQGPGSPEMTIKALSFLDDLNKISIEKFFKRRAGFAGMTCLHLLWVSFATVLQLTITYLNR